MASGLLQPGEKLDSVRELSATLGINALTVGKAYQELERDGVIEMRRGLGMFVAARAPGGDPAMQARQQAVKATAERFVLEAVQAGLSETDAVKLLTEAWQGLRTTKP